jgi:hypothetical protein
MSILACINLPLFAKKPKFKNWSKNYLGEGIIVTVSTLFSRVHYGVEIMFLDQG